MTNLRNGILPEHFFGLGMLLRCNSGRVAFVRARSCLELGQSVGQSGKVGKMIAKSRRYILVTDKIIQNVATLVRECLMKVDTNQSAVAQPNSNYIGTRFFHVQFTKHSTSGAHNSVLSFNSESFNQKLANRSR